MFNLRKYLLSGSIWVLSGKILTAVSMMGFYVITARFFPPEIVGTYFIALNVATFCSFLAQCGLGYTVVRVVSEARGRNEEGIIRAFIRKIFIIFLGSSCIVGCGYFFLHFTILGPFLFSKHDIYLGGLIAVWCILLGIQFNLGEFFRAFRLINLSSVFSGIISSILAVIFLCLFVTFYHRTMVVYPVIFCSIAALFLNALIGYHVFNKFIKKNTFCSTDGVESRIGSILSQSLPYMVSLLLFFITAQSDIWLAGVFLPKDDVAVYAAAARIALLTNLLLGIAESVIAPLIAEMNSRGETKQLELLLRKTATIALVPAMTIFFIIMLFGDKILILLYGEFYAEGYYPLLILAAAQLVMIFTGSCGPLMLMTGKQRMIMRIAVLTAFLTIFSGVLLIPHMGKNGAAMAVLISLSTQQVLRILYVRKNLAISTFVDVSLIPTLLGSIIRYKKCSSR